MKKIVLGFLMVCSFYGYSQTETIIGTTTYDRQTNASLGDRIILHQDGTISATWMYSASGDATANDRGTGYNYFDGTSWMTNPTSRIESAKTGWPTIQYTGKGEEVVISSVSTILTRPGKGSGAWTENTIPGTDKIWMKSAVGGDGDSTIHHIGTPYPGTIIDGMDTPLLYSRSEDGGLTWNILDTLLPGLDTNVFHGDRIEADAYAVTSRGNTVAIAYFGRGEDIIVLKSIDNGSTWTSTVAWDFDNSPNGTGLYTSSGFGDIVIDNNGFVHLFCGGGIVDTDATGAVSTYTYEDAIIYWNEFNGLPNNYIVTPIDYDGNGSINYTTGIWAYNWLSTMDMPTAAVAANGTMYCTYSSIVENHATGTDNYRHICAIKSIDGGTTWSSPFDITPDFDSEEHVYPDIANQVDDGLHIIYQRDDDPGTAFTNPADPFKTNDIVYQKVDTCLMRLSLTKTNESPFGMDNGTAEVQVHGGLEPFSYLWTNGSTTATATGLSSVQYGVTVMDNVGCQLQDTITVGVDSVEVFEQKIGWLGTYLPPFSKIPLKHATGKLAAGVLNTGSSDLNGVNIDFNINNGQFVENAHYGFLAPQDSVRIETVSTFTFPTIGNYDMAGILQSDEAENDTLALSSAFEVTDTVYALDNGNVGTLYGIGPGWIHGNRITLVETDTLTSMSFYITNVVDGKQFALTVHKMIDETNSELLYHSPAFNTTISMADTWTTQVLPQGVILPAGEYMIGMKAYEGNNAIVLAVDNSPAPASYSTDNGVWNVNTSNINNGFNMLRSNFGRNISEVYYPQIACSAPTGSEILDINNVAASVMNNGTTWRGAGGGSGFEVPQGSGVHSLFTGGMWIGGKDSNDELHLAANQYPGTQGTDFYAGPLPKFPLNDIADTALTENCTNFDRLWKINKTTIDSFVNGQTNGIPTAILDWPGRKNPNLDFLGNGNLAPFVDTDNDGIYNPTVGDYPNIKGDQAVWWVFNDGMGIHQNTGGLPLGIEVHVMAYAYNSGTPSIDNATFYEYSIINKNNEDLTDSYIGFFVDPDLGFHGDDFVGCDTSRNLAICYNGDDNDEGGYGANIPMVGVAMVDEPKNANGDKIHMSSFMYYNNDATVVGNPIGANEHYDYLKGIWRDGSGIVHGGNGHTSGGGTTPTKFMFPDNPTDGGGWSECAEGNTPDDRRFVMSFGPITLFANQPSSFTTATVWVPNVDYTSCPDFTPIQDSYDTIKSLFDTTICSTFTASIGVNYPGCEAEQNGVMQTVASGGAIPYFYNWSNGSTTNLATGLSSGVYHLTVTDANGCVASASRIIANSPAISVTEVVVDETCFGDNDGAIGLIKNGGVPPFSYAWNSGQTTKNINQLAQGDYTITMSDKFGCEYTGTYTVNGEDEIVHNAVVTNTSCGNDLGEIVLNPTGGSGIYDFAWSTGDTLSSVDSLAAGTYLIYVRDTVSNCLAPHSYNINNTNGPTVSVNGITNPTCDGFTDGGIDLNISGGTAPISISWSNGETTEDLSNIATGIYDVEISDASGCAAFASVQVSATNPITTQVIKQNANCGDTDGSATVNVMGGTSPYAYFWSNGETTSSLTGLGAQVYSVAVVDANGCGINRVVPISEDGAPIVLVDSVKHINCGLSNGYLSVTTFSGTTPYVYEWSNGSTTNSASGLSLGVYDLTVTGSNGCSAFASEEITDALSLSDPICLVSVDTLTGTNLIAWEKPAVDYISHYNIYRESSQAGVFVQVGTVDFDSLSTYTDPVANPMVRSWRYKISYTDTCGNETDLSDVHKTIHLTQNLGLGGTINLLWDHYEGFTVNTYYVYRYTDTQGWDLLDSLPNNLTSYTDYNPPAANNMFYVIEVVHSNGCTSTFKASSFNSSRSNRPPPIASPTQGVAPTVDFSQTGTSVVEGGTLDFTDLSTENPTAWSWTFEGGTPASSTDQNPTGVQYNSVGVYDVTLIATNTFGVDSIVKVDHITVTTSGAAPVSDFAASAVSIEAGNTVDFTDNTVNNPTSWFWVFSGGNPTTSLDQNPTGISYANAGTYDVMLITTNTFGSDTLTKPAYIEVTTTIGVEELNTTETVQVFPNPTTDVTTLSIKAAVNEKAELAIYNALGQLVLSETLQLGVGQNTKELQLKQFGAGVYKAEVKRNNATQTIRVVVK